MREREGEKPRPLYNVAREIASINIRAKYITHPRESRGFILLPNYSVCVCARAERMFAVAHKHGNIMLVLTARPLSLSLSPLRILFLLTENYRVALALS